MLSPSASNTLGFDGYLRRWRFVCSATRLQCNIRAGEGICLALLLAHGRSARYFAPSHVRGGPQDLSFDGYLRRWRSAGPTIHLRDSIRGGSYCYRARRSGLLRGAHGFAPTHLRQSSPPLADRILSHVYSGGASYLEGRRVQHCAERGANYTSAYACAN